MSRKLEDLHPDLQPLAHQFLAECERTALEVLIICTYRSNSEQAALYAQGRTLPGKIVTWAQPGHSFHNYTNADGLPASKAFDFVVLRHGKIIWGTGGNGIDDDPSDDGTDDLELWQRAGSVAESLGLAWAGRWPKGQREFPHVQMKA